MPLHCVGEKLSPTQTDEDSDDDEQGEVTSYWQEAPDSILLHIFGFLDVQSLYLVAQSCKTWYRVACDESLWKNLMKTFLCISECTLPPGKLSWKSEVKRFRYHQPNVLTETLQHHTDEVLHVSFSHNGKLFSTTSKDATLKIWTLGMPTTLKYTKDFRELLSWDFTQYSCFNESDTMVLVSSVKTTGYMDRRGYMAVLSLIHDFEILRIVTMDPSQLFGAWLDNTTFLGGSLEISLDRFATTVQIEAYDVPEIFSPLPRPSSPYVEESSGRTLFTFSSETASLIKFLTVAVIPSPVNSETKDIINEMDITDINGFEHDGNSDLPSCSQTGTSKVDVSGITDESSVYSYVLDSPDGFLCEEHDNSSICFSGQKQIMFDNEIWGSRKIEKYKFSNSLPGAIDANFTRSKESEITETDLKQKRQHQKHRDKLRRSDKSSYLIYDEKLEDLKYSSNTSDKQSSYFCDRQSTPEDIMKKNLIFVTGEFAVALHQLGFKNVPPYAKESVLARGITQMEEDNPESFMVVNYSNNDIHFVRRQQETDKPDNLLDLYGHVTGLCLTEDQRYLFINCRPWIGNVDRTDPWATPDLSPNIEIRIIDLLTLKDLGVRYVGHKGFSPSNMCCFVFLDVSQDYVASGSEDSHGYLWDKHYGVLTAKYGHESGVVNAVGFNPKNQEVLVTVSDDSTIKVWRSKHEANLYHKSMEVQT